MCEQGSVGLGFAIDSDTSIDAYSDGHFESHASDANDLNDASRVMLQSKMNQTR